MKIRIKNPIWGVPITFLNKYNPKQFEIIKFRKGDDDKDLSVNGKAPYFRILIRKIMKQIHFGTEVDNIFSEVKLKIIVL